MSDNDLQKIRMKKLQNLMKQQAIPRNIVQLRGPTELNQLNKDFPNMIVVIDCWASWCTPCLAFGPIFEKLQQEYYQDFIFAKLNVDENQVVASHYKITSIPTILFIKNGVVVNKIVGALPYANMKKFLEKNGSF